MRDTSLLSIIFPAFRDVVISLSAAPQLTPKCQRYFRAHEAQGVR